MEDIDKLIKETLTEAEAKFYDELEDKNVISMVTEVLTGKNSWIVILMNIVSLIAFGFFVYCVVMVFKTEDTNTLIKWIALGFMLLNMSGMIKLYMWMQLDKNTLLKEIKRLELLVSSLLHKI